MTSGKVLIASVSVACTLAMSTPGVQAASKSKEKSAPSGTLLLPLTPKIDDGSGFTPPVIAPSVKVSPVTNRRAKEQWVPADPLPSANDDSSSKQKKTKVTSAPAPKSTSPNRKNVQAQPAVSAVDPVSRPSAPVGQTTQEGAPLPKISTTSDPSAVEAAEEQIDEALAPIDENSLLKGTVQIVADDTEYDQQRNTFLGTGNAVALIAGQDARLEADTILYDQNSQTIDARGNVKIVRNGQLTTGSSFKFKVNSDEYLITKPDTEIEGTTVTARYSRGTRKALAFRDGAISLPKPINITNNAAYGPISSAEQFYEQQAHPEAYLPERPSFKFTARKMTYERYKDTGNLTVFGGRIVADNFTIPLPKFTATVGKDNTRVVFPVTPLVGNNLMVGGLHLGPSFNYAVGKSGVFSWGPTVQIGGRSVETGQTENNNGRIGAGFRLGYTNDKITSHLAYGSVSNILVGDFKAKISKSLFFQSGINRFLNDGLFGARRPRLMGEFVHTKNISSIPYIGILSFRTSAGWAQDSPSLVDLSGSAYSQLFNTTGYKGKIGAFRLQEQVTASSHPIFSIGDNKYGAQMNLFGGVAARAYSTGDGMLMGQFGPMLNLRLNRIRIQSGYAQSGVSGKSPFVFDQFIQGNRSTFLGGDIRVAKWLTLGANLGYNLDAKMLYQRTITAAIGPEDFKVLLSRDTIRGINRFGFSVMSGSPIPYDKLVLKGSPDHGQTGNGI